MTTNLISRCHFQLKKAISNGSVKADVLFINILRQQRCTGIAIKVPCIMGIVADVMHSRITEVSNAVCHTELQKRKQPVD